MYQGSKERHGWRRVSQHFLNFPLRDSGIYTLCVPLLTFLRHKALELTMKLLTSTPPHIQQARRHNYMQRHSECWSAMTTTSLSQTGEGVRSSSPKLDAPGSSLRTYPSFCVGCSHRPWVQTLVSATHVSREHPPKVWPSCVTFVEVRWPLRHHLDTPPEDLPTNKLSRPPVESESECGMASSRTIPD